jgi:predicted DNA-binding transcriptional regulator AlpA
MTKDPICHSIDRLFVPAEAAKLLSLSLSWLAKARLRGDGPRYVKIGRAVRYGESCVYRKPKS